MQKLRKVQNYTLCLQSYSEGHREATHLICKSTSRMSLAGTNQQHFPKLLPSAVPTFPEKPGISKKSGRTLRSRYRPKRGHFVTRNNNNRLSSPFNMMVEICWDFSPSQCMRSPLCIEQWMQHFRIEPYGGKMTVKHSNYLSTASPCVVIVTYKKKLMKYHNKNIPTLKWLGCLKDLSQSGHLNRDWLLWIIIW